MRLRQVLTAVVVSGSLVFWAGGGWAQDAPPISDDVASTSEETVPMEIPVLPVPKIEYTLNGNEVLIIISGIDEVAIKGFLFNGSDITQLVSDMIASGAMTKEVNDAGNITGLRFSVDNPLSLEGATLGVVLDSNSVISNQIHFESQDKWVTQAVNIVLSSSVAVASAYLFSPGEKKIESITGTAKDVNSGCLWIARGSSPCTTFAPKDTRVFLYIYETQGKTQTWGKNWIADTYVQDKGDYFFGTITTADGKSYCGPVKVKAEWYSQSWVQSVKKENYILGDTCSRYGYSTSINLTGTVKVEVPFW